MNLQHLSDQELLDGNERLTNQSREVLTTLLHYLRETERRRLFSTLKFPSLFEYLVGKLKFSEPEANRRISALRLLKELPEIEEKISSGALSMTTLVMARTLFTKEKQAGRTLDKIGKVKVLAKLENQSTRTAQKILAEINPEMKKTKSLDFNSIEDEALREKLLKVKGRFAHIDPNMTLSDILHRLCDQELEKKTKLPAAPKVESKAQIERDVWQKAQGQCTNCRSHFALESDHIVPLAKGGSNTRQNKRLLCRSCNQRAAIEHFGLTKMARFLKSPEFKYRANFDPKLQY